MRSLGGCIGLSVSACGRRRRLLRHWRSLARLTDIRRLLGFALPWVDLLLDFWLVFATTFPAGFAFSCFPLASGFTGIFVAGEALAAFSDFFPAEG